MNIPTWQGYWCYHCYCNYHWYYRFYYCYQCYHCCCCGIRRRRHQSMIVIKGGVWILPLLRTPIPCLFIVTNVTVLYVAANFLNIPERSFERPSLCTCTVTDYVLNDRLIFLILFLLFLQVSLTFALLCGRTWSRCHNVNDPRLPQKPHGTPNKLNPQHTPIFDI